MSLFELAALIGLLLAGVVVMITALDARRDARAGAEEAKAAADRIALAEERILRMESRVQGHHDCVRAVPVAGEFRAMVERDSKLPPTEPNPTVLVERP